MEDTRSNSPQLTPLQTLIASAMGVRNEWQCVQLIGRSAAVAAGGCSSGSRQFAQTPLAAYHLLVTRLLIIFMILLLPLRGWAGDRMSIQMAASGSESRAVSEMPADCPMLAMANGSKADADHTKSPSGVGCCASCGLCTPMAEWTDITLRITTFVAHAWPLTGGIDFISSSPTPTLKPPIS